METEGNKRKLEDISKEVVLPEYDTCVHCKRKIDMNSEWAEPCNYHPGQKVLNAMVWHEHPEWSTKLMEEKIDDPAFGSGFKWMCCEEDANHNGCQTGKHKGEKYPDAVRKTHYEDEIEPGAKHHKVDGSSIKSSGSVIDLTDEVEAPKAATLPSKAEEVITIPDSSEVEEESEEEDSEGDVESEYIETCTFCGQEYSSNDDEGTCLSHDEYLVIVEDCPLSEAEKEALDEEKSPEWFVWRCCGEPADSEGCRMYDYHNPDRGLGY